MNRPEIDIGPELANLRGFSQGLPSKDKGHAIGNSEKIRVAHNSFTRQDPFVMDDEDKPASKDSEDVFHFISFVPHKNTLYELDGLQAGPISHGECSDETWLALAREQIQQRIEAYASNEIRFNLLAVIGD
jgi:ubiquitin carboxyl-terminal hydrolase L5